MRTIAFETIPVEVAQQLSEQIECAMQIIAALVFTPEEVLAATQKEGIQAWATRMREDLLSPEWRTQLVEVVTAQGFLTNTHPGFPIGGLERPVPPLRLVGPVYKDMEAMLLDYASGNGEDISEEDGEVEILTRINQLRADRKEFWTAKLVEKGHDPKVVAWCLDYGGYRLALEAGTERHMVQFRNRGTTT